MLPCNVMLHTDALYLGRNAKEERVGNKCKEEVGSVRNQETQGSRKKTGVIAGR